NALCVIKQFSPPEPIQRHPELLAKAIALFNQEAEQLHALGKHPQIPELMEDKWVWRDFLKQNSVSA
ncbi:hypothetical protein, partial [Trichothermofontia sp.]